MKGCTTLGSDASVFDAKGYAAGNWLPLEFPYPYLIGFTRQHLPSPQTPAKVLCISKNSLWLPYLVASKTWCDGEVIWWILCSFLLSVCWVYTTIYINSRFFPAYVGRDYSTPWFLETPFVSYRFIQSSGHTGTTIASWFCLCRLTNFREVNRDAFWL